MNKAAYNFTNRQGITLAEILMAAGFLAMAFIPIMGLLTSSIKITDKDQGNIIAMNLCQEKLNTALQFEFGHFNSWLGSQITNTKTASGSIELDLHPVTINGMTFNFKLLVSDRPGFFTLRSRNFEAEASNAVDDWVFEPEPTTVSYTNLVHRYRMTVEWSDRANAKAKRDGAAVVKDYTLVTFKANINR
jgi:hypothetical protein